MNLSPRRVRLRISWFLCAAASSILLAAATAAAAPTNPPHRALEPAGPAQPSLAPRFNGPAGTPSPWTPLTHQPSIAPGSMLLMTDGSVLVHQDNKGVWWKLTPNSSGSYVNGSWSQVTSMPPGYRPEYFASAVLPDGRLIVEGGEYNGGSKGEWTTRGAIYDPVTDAWATVAPPAGWTTIGDAQSEVLPNGTFMLANCCTTQSALLNPADLTWSPTGAGKADINDEEGWTLLPTNQVITVDSSLSVENAVNGTEAYNPATGSWSAAGLTPAPLPDAAYELGPQVFNPTSSSMLAIGATGATATYRTRNGSWTAGPSLPVIGGQQYDSADGAAALLPDGNILLDASPGDYAAPTHFFLYNGKSFTQVPDTANATSISSFQTRMLVLPTGQILYDDGYDMEVYTPSGSAASGLAPAITSVPTNLSAGRTYQVSGTQLAGRAQGAAYGDDFQDNTNYPLVRIVNQQTGTVTYARTSGFSSVSIAPGAVSSASFTIPAATPAGVSRLSVVADGVASSPVTVNVG